jgi:hypothetical protein
MRILQGTQQRLSDLWADGKYAAVGKRPFAAKKKRMAAKKKRMMAGERSNTTDKKNATANEKKYHDGKGEFGSKRKKCSRRW